MSLYDSLQEKLDNVHVYGHYFSACCPFHNDSSPSFFVYEESEKKSMEFRCAGCGKHGSLAYLDKFLGSHHRQGLTRSHSSKPVVLPRWSRWEREYGGLEGIADHAHDALKRYKQFQKFFERRKINEYIDEGHFGYLDGWATFPVFTPEHRLIDIVVRAISGKGDTRYVVSPVNYSGIRPLYSPDWKRVAEAQTIYVPFGMIDTWAIHAVGLATVTGITGKSLSAENLKPLGKRYVIVPDCGEEREAYNLANKLGWRAKVQRLNYEEDTKDPDDIRRTFGNQYLLSALGA